MVTAESGGSRLKSCFHVYEPCDPECHLTSDLSATKMEILTAGAEG